MFSLINTLNYFLIGICIGSFLNVIVFRLPRKISLISPRSFCPKCKKMITWKENIPLISWLIQRGRCTGCNTEISFRYPIIEFSTGILFVLFSYSSPYLYSFRNFSGFELDYFQNIFSWFFLSLLFVISFIDFIHLWIPQSLINLGFIMGGLNLFFAQIISNPYKSSLFVECSLACFLSYIIFEFIRISAKYFYRKDALGKGDSKLVSLLALWLGPFGIVLSIGITYIFAAICILVALKLKLIKKDQLIPFAPFLSLGGLSVWFFGNQLLIQNIFRF